MNDANGEMELVAKTIFGLEEIVAADLKDLGATDIELHNRAVSFKGNLELIYKCNLTLGTALRILIPITRFEVENEQQFYSQIQKIDWEEYIGVDDTIA